MTYIKSHSSTSSWGRLHYIFDDEAHDGSDHRVLSVAGNNIRLLGARGHPNSDQSGYYLNIQFKNVRKKAWNSHKHQQAQHLILSFSEEEFSTRDDENLKEEANQINMLVKQFMYGEFPDCQWVSGIQCDGEGHKLHAHVLINSVKPDGKCVRTNKFKISKLRNNWNDFMDENYLAVTGHVYVNPFKKDKAASNVKPKGWQKQVQETLEWAKNKAETIENYLTILRDKGITVSRRNKRGDWSYHFKVNGKDKTVRDFYQRIDKKSGLVKSTRGLGKDYTPTSLKEYFENKKEVFSGGKRKKVIRKNERIGGSGRVDERRRIRIDGKSSEQRESSNETGSTEHGGGHHEPIRQSRHESDFER
ncbi:relaxase/mobilization nuclease domain-containing protein [Companilactobacillus futsaii]|uniref:relaxase/mobilization nuclease domain-containing protein n=1 Tax=Companilactobacillus futsaii TaxID=938155 RepID=UPI00189F6BC1|nr:relaxase/mobilization nuclease domain-containing protein [Companilactobacillus futsaii]